MIVQPYLFLEGRCEEALDFYTRTLGAKVTMKMRYDEAPEAPPPGMLPPGSEKKVMHSAFTIGDSLIMASDGCVAGEQAFKGFSLSITADSEQQARQMFEALSEGGTVKMPMNKTFWSPCFGMLEDKFGIGWMIGLNPA
ncbi:VOC family protein [Uliginosibacterium sp. sgz301328]|uniref:VOC family protein n=1 Tax=Uliginosibacterium sp. sgz301328 TaxID=3243764 RepID=UPI00359D512C